MKWITKSLKEKEKEKKKVKTQMRRRLRKGIRMRRIRMRITVRMMLPKTMRIQRVIIVILIPKRNQKGKVRNLNHLA